MLHYVMLLCYVKFYVFYVMLNYIMLFYCYVKLCIWSVFVKYLIYDIIDIILYYTSICLEMNRLTEVFIHECR